MSSKSNKSVTESNRNLADMISVCIWGEWFGGRIGESPCLLVEKKLDTNNHTLTLNFDENERCVIVHPVDVVWKGKRITIKSAEKITWEYYSYGRPQTEETRGILEYSMLDDSHVHVVEKSESWNRDEIIGIIGKVALDTF